MDAARLKELAAKAAPLPTADLTELDPNMELHVDGDYCAYYYSGNDETEFSTAKHNMLDAMNVARRIAGAGGKIVIHLTSGLSDKGKRFDIATVKPYQGQRDAGRKPKNWEALRNWLEMGTWPDPYRIVIWKDREADDGVAAAARYAFQQGRNIGIYSRDKDFRMIPGLHVVWTTLQRVQLKPGDWAITDENGLVYGEKWFWLQMLQGDTADNIPGLEMQPAKGGGFKACGAACAETYLAHADAPNQAFIIVRELYRKYYGGSWADRFVEQAALLWMRNDNAASPQNFQRALYQADKEVDAAIYRLLRRIK